MSPSWWVKISDFGIAKCVRGGDATELRTATGTPGYEAPEIRGYIEMEEDKLSSVYSNVADIWSLGCVIHEAVAKQVPFQNGKDIKRFCDKKITFPAQSLQEKLTANGIDFIQSILVANPSDRPSAVVALQHPWFLYEDMYPSSSLQQRSTQLDEKKLSTSAAIERAIVEAPPKAVKEQAIAERHPARLLQKLAIQFQDASGSIGKDTPIDVLQHRNDPIATIKVAASRKEFNGEGTLSYKAPRGLLK